MNRPHTSDIPFREDESLARELDAEDPLGRWRDQFLIPTTDAGREVVYFAGNSLGLQPRRTKAIVDQELADWARLGVEGHFRGKRPWYSYHEQFRENGARLVGGQPGEVVIMNSLTVNLHLMMVSFYRPTPERYKIVMESTAFPSDTYALKSQLDWHGFDVDEGLIVVRPREGEHTIRTEDVEDLLAREGKSIALVCMAGVNYFTGQVFDMDRITSASHAQGCHVGWDLAHAAGNVPLSLHDWNVDFAVWCNYKYLNSGPGALGGCFVHERHGETADLDRFAGWWGNDPATRFRMHLQPDFVPRAGADGWQISNPPIFSAAPVLASYEMFDEVGLAALREKSQRLTGYLQQWLDHLSPRRFEVITPRESDARGCQLSMLVHDRPRELFQALEADDVVCDFREPNVIRVAPVPLYNTYHDVWTFAQVLARHDRAES